MQVSMCAALDRPPFSSLSMGVWCLMVVPGIANTSSMLTASCALLISDSNRPVYCTSPARAAKGLAEGGCRWLFLRPRTPTGIKFISIL